MLRRSHIACALKERLSAVPTVSVAVLADFPLLRTRHVAVNAIADFSPTKTVPPLARSALWVLSVLLVLQRAPLASVAFTPTKMLRWCVLLVRLVVIRIRQASLPVWTVLLVRPTAWTVQEHVSIAPPARRRSSTALFCAVPVSLVPFPIKQRARFVLFVRVAMLKATTVKLFVSHVPLVSMLTGRGEASAVSVRTAKSCSIPPSRNASSALMALKQPIALRVLCVLKENTILVVLPVLHAAQDRSQTKLG
jgi:hypothetical protein